MTDQPHDPVPFRPYVHNTQPDYDSPSYGSTHKRHPKQPLVRMPHTVTEITGPRFSPKQFPPCTDIAKVDGHEAMGECTLSAVNHPLTKYVPALRFG